MYITLCKQCIDFVLDILPNLGPFYLAFCKRLALSAGRYEDDIISASDY